MAKNDEIDMSLDDLDLDMDIMGGEDDLMDNNSNGNRKPSGVTKEFFAGMLNGVGTGLKNVGSDEFNRKFPKTAEVKNEIGQTFSEFNDLRKDLQKQLQPMLTSLEMSSQKLLPKAKKLIPTRLYDKISKKLDARAKLRREEASSQYRERSKEELEQESINSEIADLFSTQAELSQATQAENRQSTVLNQALEATRSHKMNAGLNHIYEAARGTELFHRTVHTAYMKKSLELKYKHLFATRDVFNLMKQQSFMMESYLKGIAKNTSIPDFMKERPTDHIFKERTQSFGTTLAGYTSNFRKNLLKKVKDKAMGVMQGGLKTGTDMLAQMADAADMAKDMPGAGDAIKGAGANSIGSMLSSFIINNTVGGAGVRAFTEKISPYTADLEQSLGNVKTKGLVKLNQWRQKMAGGGGGIFGNILAGLADMIPGMEPMTQGSNDLLADSEQTANFDRMTRQSIVEIIPGFLGKILQSVDGMRTGKMGEETVYDIRSRTFTSVSRMKESAAEALFGDESTRTEILGKSIGTLKAGYAASHSEKATEKAFKDADKLIYKVLFNHAISGVWLDLQEIKQYVVTGQPTEYINKIINNVDRPREILSLIWNGVINKQGYPDKGLVTSLETALARVFDSDAYKSELPRMFEAWGQRRFFSDDFTKVERDRLQKAADNGNKEAAALLKKGEGMIQAGNKFNVGSIAVSATDMDYSNVAITSRREMMAMGDEMHKASGLRQDMTNVAGKAGAKAASLASGPLNMVRKFFGKFGVEIDSVESLYKVLSGTDASKLTEAAKEKMNKAGYSIDNVSNWAYGALGIDPAIAEEKLAASKALAEREAYMKSWKFRKSKAGMGLKSNADDPEWKKLYDRAQLADETYLEAENKRDSVANQQTKEQLSQSSADIVSRFQGSTNTHTPSSSKSTATDSTMVVDAIKDMHKGVDSHFGDLMTQLMSGISVKDKLEEPNPEQSADSSVISPTSLLLDEFKSWREEYTSVSGTLFDAIMYVAEHGKGGGGEGEKKRGFFGKFGSGARALGRKVGGAAKWTANAYVKFYSGVVQKSMSAAGYVGKGLLKGIGASPYLDIYVKGEIGPKPLVTWKQQAYDPGIIFADDKKRVPSSKDINRPCIDPRTGNIVITEEDLAKGLVTISNNPIGAAFKMAALGIGRGVNTLAKGYFGIYGKAISAIGGILKSAASGIFGSKAEQFFDVYLKDKVEPGKPILSARQQEEGVFFKGKKRVIRTSDITEPVFAPSGAKGGRARCLINQKDIDHGLVDINNKPITKGHTASAGLLSNLAGIGNTVAKVLGQGALKGGDLYAHVFKGLFDLGKKGVGGLGTMFGRALGLKGNGLGEEGVKPITDRMDKMIMLLTNIVTNTNKKKNKAGDKDGDGIIDGSYADQMKNKKGEEKDKVDLDSLHVDTDHSLNKDEDDEEGQGGNTLTNNPLTDMLGRTKTGRRLRARGRLLKSKTLRAGKTALSKTGGFLKNAGGKGLKLGGRLLGKSGSLLARGGSMLAGKLPMLASVGTKIPLLGSLLGMGGTAAAGTAAAGGAGALAAGGGLAGLAGAALPAAAVAAALYGGYRMASGLGTKNTQENLGIEDERDVLFEDRLASAAGFNTKIGAKMARGLQSVNPLIGLIKGIRGNDNPMTPEEVEQGRNKLQNKINKGLPGYDKILSEYEKALEDHNWNRARQLCGKEADGIIASMWKHSITGKVVGALGNLLLGNKDKPLTEEEQEKTRAKFNSMIGKGNKQAEKLLEKFNDACSEGEWKKAREIAGLEEKGLLGKMFTDSKGNVKWGSAIGAAFGPVGYLIGSLFNSADKDAPMSDQEIKESRDYLNKLASSGNKAAERILEQFEEAVTEQRWKKARALVGKDVKSNLSKLGSAVKSTVKWGARIGTLGLSMLFETSNDEPMKNEEIKKFSDKMNYLISKGDKVAQKKLDAFESAIASQNWEKARRISKMAHKPAILRAAKAVVGWWYGDNEKEMTEQEIQKFRDSMNRKIEMGNKAAQKKLDAFEDAIGRQNWKKARLLADNPDEGVAGAIRNGIGKGIMGIGRFFFGGDGASMSDEEIEKARKGFEADIADGKKGAQKRLDKFEDFVADEKWEKARALAKMPYESLGKRVGKAIGGFLFGSKDKEMSPAEIDQFQKECEQRIADGDAKAEKVLEKFNSAVEAERWEKAREISGFKDWGVVGEVGKAAKSVWNFLTGNKDREDCLKLQEKIEEKSLDDETGVIAAGLEEFETLVRRRKFNEANELGEDLLNLSPKELKDKRGFNTAEFEAMEQEANKLIEQVLAAEEKNNGWTSPIKEMKLAMLRRSIKNNADNWGDEFFADARDKLSEITGEPVFGEGEGPSEDDSKRGEKLLEDIDKSSSNYSWIGSPLIKSKLASLKTEVKSSVADWDDDTLSSWYEKLGEIDKDFKGEEKSEEESSSEEEDTSEDESTGETGKYDNLLFNEGDASWNQKLQDAGIGGDEPPPPPEEAMPELIPSNSSSLVDSANGTVEAAKAALNDTSSPEAAKKGVGSLLSGGGNAIRDFFSNNKSDGTPNKSIFSGITDLFKSDKPAGEAEASSGPKSLFDYITGGTKATTAAVARSSSDTLKQASDMTSAFNQLLQQNQQLITMLGAVMTANGVKIEGMGELVSGVNKPTPAPQIINNTTSNNTAGSNGDVGFDVRKA